MARRRRAALLLVLALGVTGSVVGITASRFSSDATEQFDVSAAPDWTAPTVSNLAIGRVGSYDTGFIRQGTTQTYHVYANVTDNGNPAAGVGTVTADVSSVTTGQTSVALTAGSYSAGGVAYGYRTSSAIAPNGTLTAGSKAFTLSASDLASPVNSLSPPASGSVTVDNTAPTPTSVSTTNAGIAGRPEAGDTISFTWNEPVNPFSVQANWNGSATNCVVRIDNNTATGSNDQLVVYDATNTTVLPLTTSGAGSSGVNLRAGNYVNQLRTYGASGTPSTMTRSGNSVVVTLGTQNAGGTNVTQTAAAQMIWYPTATVTDRAGNPATTAQITAPSKIEF